MTISLSNDAPYYGAIPVNVGINPNDGTGDNIRNAFITTNTNLSSIVNFLFTSDPAGPLVPNLSVLNNATIYGNVGVAETITANSVQVANDVVINGSLTVFGNTTTITTAEYVISNPTLELGTANIAGGQASLTVNDGQNRGVNFYWYDTSIAQQVIGFFGWENSTGDFIFVPNISSGIPGNTTFNTVNANNLTINSKVDISSISETTSSISQTPIASLPVSTYRSATFTIQAIDNTGSKYHTATVLAVHNGTTATSTEFGAIDIGGQAATYTVDILGGNLRLLATPTSTNTTTFTVSITATKG